MSGTANDLERENFFFLFGGSNSGLKNEPRSDNLFREGRCTADGNIYSYLLKCNAVLTPLEIDLKLAAYFIPPVHFNFDPMDFIGISNK